MKPKTIGIVGGAGPLAGAYLLTRILSIASSKYGCQKNTDFPEVILISFPFSDMLSSKKDSDRLQRELTSCLMQLRKNRASVLAIACNTLHAFLNKNENNADLISLPKVTADEIKDNNTLVLCTSTSVEFGLHKQFMPCDYPDISTQIKIDHLIHEILKGADFDLMAQELLTIVNSQTANTILLGCTELSLLSERLVPCNKTIFDPIEIAANRILEKSFLNKRT